RTALWRRDPAGHPAQRRSRRGHCRGLDGRRACGRGSRCAAAGRRRMRLRTVLLLGCAAFAHNGIAPAAAAEPPREVHGSADAYGSDGLKLIWAVLRGPNEAATVVVLRIAADPQRYPMVAVVGRNPFSQQAKPLLDAKATADGVELRVARSHFADFPRTELRFYGSAAAAQADAPQLVVYFLGVPDTTPEFASEDRLRAYVSDRSARLGADGKGSP